MKPEEQELLNSLRNASSFEAAFEGDSHLNQQGAPAASVSRASGQPVYDAQFDLEVKTYFINTAGAGTIVTPANLPAALQVSQPVYLFGHIDYAGGYAVSQSKVPRNAAWIFNLQYRYLVDDPAGLPAITPALVNAKSGDMITLWLQTSGGVNYAMVQILTSPNVAYSSLLEAISSDRFVINKLRLNVQSDNFVSQFKNGFTVIKQTLFGKSSDDQYSANSFINPFNNLKYICDVPLTMPVDKNKTLAFLMNYDCQDETISVFVKTVNKLSA